MCAPTMITLGGEREEKEERDNRPERSLSHTPDTRQLQNTLVLTEQIHINNAKSRDIVVTRSQIQIERSIINMWKLKCPSRWSLREPQHRQQHNVRFTKRHKKADNLVLHS